MNLTNKKTSIGPQSQTVATGGETSTQVKFALINTSRYLKKCLDQFGRNSAEYIIYQRALFALNYQKDYYHPNNRVILQPFETALTYAYLEAVEKLTNRRGIKKAIDNLVAYHYITVELRAKVDVDASVQDGNKFKKPVTVIKVITVTDDLVKYVGVKDMKRSDNAKERACRDHQSAQELEDAKDYAYLLSGESNIFRAIDLLSEKVTSAEQRAITAELNSLKNSNRISYLESEVKDLKSAYYDLQNEILDLMEE